MDRVPRSPAGLVAPNILITYGETGGDRCDRGQGQDECDRRDYARRESSCVGAPKVTPTLLTGEYTCRGITSYEPGKGMGKVDIKVTFKADS